MSLDLYEVRVRPIIVIGPDHNFAGVQDRHREQPTPRHQVIEREKEAETQRQRD